MATETILQHWIFTQFILPFALITAIVYGILEKTKLLGEDKHQLNAIIAFVIGLVFTGAVFPKLVVENLILFLTVGIVVLFVILMLWGFVSGVKDKDKGFELEKWMKYVLWIVAGIAVIGAVIWSTGWDNPLMDFLFYSSWSSDLWTNVAFIAVIIVVLVLIIKNKGE